MVQIIILALLASLSMNEYFFSPTAENSTLKPDLNFESKSFCPNKSCESNDFIFEENFHNQHPLSSPSIRHPTNKPQIIVTKKYKQYLNGLQRFVKGLMTKVTKVNQSVKGFFSKFKKQNKKNEKRPHIKQPAQPTSPITHKIRLIPTVVDPKVTEQTAFLNDHVEMDITKLPLTSSQIETLHKAHDSVLARSSEYTQWAAETQLVLSPHLAYRYYVSVDWSDTYNEQR